MTNKTNNTRIDTLGCDNLVDNAFVPDCTKSMGDKLREEAGVATTIKLGDIFSAGFTVDKSHKGTPETGCYRVKIIGEPEVKSGKFGAYVDIELEEQVNGLCWKTFVNTKDMEKMLQDISYYNSGMLSGMHPMAAINKLMKDSFTVWVLIDEKDKVVTYFNENKYNRRLYAISLNEGNKELKELKKKEREDNDIRMAEEAKLGRDKAPWEDK